MPDKNGLNVLYDLLDFCKERKLNVLFVVCPYQITKEDYEKYNVIKDIVLEYGFDFINANDYYDEMKIDFSTDFMDKNHVNYFGAEKYTNFLASYIKHNYNLSDHRGSKKYMGWNMAYEEFCDEKNDVIKVTNELISNTKEGKKIADILSETTNFFQWCELVNDSRFTLLVAGGDFNSDSFHYIDEKALSRIGIYDFHYKKNYRVICEGDVIYSNKEPEDLYFEGTLGESGISNIPYIIDNQKQSYSIKINNKECSLDCQEGINVVVFENDYQYVVDKVVLKLNDKGEIELIRK